MAGKSKITNVKPVTYYSPVIIKWPNATDKWTEGFNFEPVTSLIMYACMYVTWLKEKMKTGNNWGT